MLILYFIFAKQPHVDFGRSQSHIRVLINHALITCSHWHVWNFWADLFSWNWSRFVVVILYSSQIISKSHCLVQSYLAVVAISFEITWFSGGRNVVLVDVLLLDDYWVQIELLRFTRNLRLGENITEKINIIFWFIFLFLKKINRLGLCSLFLWLFTNYILEFLIITYDFIIKIINHYSLLNARIYCLLPHFLKVD